MCGHLIRSGLTSVAYSLQQVDLSMSWGARSQPPGAPPFFPPLFYYTSGSKSTPVLPMARVVLRARPPSDHPLHAQPTAQAFWRVANPHLDLAHLTEPDGPAARRHGRRPPRRRAWGAGLGPSAAAAPPARPPARASAARRRGSAAPPWR